jgi:hypothetical protein
LYFFYGYIIDQSEAWVGSECTLNAINPNSSKKPRTYDTDTASRSYLAYGGTCTFEHARAPPPRSGFSWLLHSSCHPCLAPPSLLPTTHSQLCDINRKRLQCTVLYYCTCRQLGTNKQQVQEGG